MRDNLVWDINAGLTKEVVFHEGGLSKEVVFHEGGLSKEVVFHEGGLSKESTVFPNNHIHS